MYNVKRDKKLKKDDYLTRTIEEKDHAERLHERYCSISLRRPILRCDIYSHQKNQVKKLLFTVNNLKMI